MAVVTIDNPNESIYAQICHIYRVTRHPVFVNLDIEQRAQQADSYWAYLKNDPNWHSSFKHFKSEHEEYVSRNDIPDGTMKKKEVITNDKCDLLNEWSKQFLWIYSNDQDIIRKQQEKIDKLSKIVELFTNKYIIKESEDDGVYAEGLTVQSDW
mmetsp:Transcript_68507/g.61553  ORF Transcript_68507/g.61553 Transcript_68507/m.61553 type:complete len:154 (+) Transcript_68507:32-493(+)|eukprot:CAMPEP_0201581712 /NCGR_PEP_ID=MMETSP0190_2-20130828/74289_1 /ASSEMBLY_ACC=CAM_ASM_000263 /TAXON_ID=37353 /ORGANISM="Rosalina sp." /LENGTH=153 /DNA_ID=CAMNT_0048020283 /DNA_START=31 /DNA_END=492 /DNA_ORIENTATION=-